MDSSFDLKELVRPNIRDLKPYSSARDEYKGEASVYLDANENPYNGPYNRYPDPLQWKVKTGIGQLKRVPPENILLGNGSDEPIDLLYRAFCEPGIDNVVAIDPSYGMYQVCAGLNNVEYRRVRLDDSFGLNADQLLAATDSHTKLIFLCSPNNPSGNSLERSQVEMIIRRFHGIVVVDEAYIDFSSDPGYLGSLAQWPNLVVLQTFSKAWGSAAIRLGMAFASKEIIHVLNKIKYPYNINLLTQEYALELLSRADFVKAWVADLLVERDALAGALKNIPLVQKVYPSDANFLLVKVPDARRVYDYLVARGIIVRNRNGITLCDECLRITVGTSVENRQLTDALMEFEQVG